MSSLLTRRGNASKNEREALDEEYQLFQRSVVSVPREQFDELQKRYDALLAKSGDLSLLEDAAVFGDNYLKIWSIKVIDGILVGFEYEKKRDNRWFQSLPFNGTKSASGIIGLALASIGLSNIETKGNFISFKSPVLVHKSDLALDTVEAINE